MTSERIKELNYLITLKEMGNCWVLELNFGTRTDSVTYKKFETALKELKRSYEIREILKKKEMSEIKELLKRSKHK